MKRPSFVRLLTGDASKSSMDDAKSTISTKKVSRKAKMSKRSPIGPKPVPLIKNDKQLAE